MPQHLDALPVHPALALPPLFAVVAVRLLGKDRFEDLVPCGCEDLVDLRAALSARVRRRAARVRWLFVRCPPLVLSGHAASLTPY